MYIYEDNLESKRLKTRFLTLNDIPLWADFLKDKEAIKYFPNANFPSVEERSKFWIEKQLARYENKQYGLQALYTKDTNEFVGQCGLLEQSVDGIKEIEVGYHILPKFWGKGYAPEAAKLFFDYGFSKQVSDSIISIIHVQNIKSQRVAEKNGLQREKQSRWNDLDVFIYRLKK